MVVTKHCIVTYLRQSKIKQGRTKFSILEFCISIKVRYLLEFGTNTRRIRRKRLREEFPSYYQSIKRFVWFPDSSKPDNTGLRSQGHYLSGLIVLGKGNMKKKKRQKKIRKKSDVLFTDGFHRLHQINYYRCRSNNVVKSRKSKKLPDYRLGVGSGGSVL